MPDSNAAVARDPGLSVRSSGDHVARTADCTLVDPTAPPAELWARLVEADGVQTRLYHALVALSRDCAREDASVPLQDPSRRGWRAADPAALPAADVLGGAWVHQGLRAVEADGSDQWRAFVATTRRLHGSNETGIDGSLDATADAVGLWEHVDAHDLDVEPERPASVPRAVVDLGGEWAQQPARRRRTQLRWLVAWSSGIDVQLVATGMVARRLVEDHADVLPGSAVSQLREHLQASALAGAGDAPTAEIVADALAALADDLTAWRVLHVIAEPPSQQRTHEALKADQRLSWPRSDGADWDRIRRACKRLVDAGLVATDRDGQTWTKRLTAAGHVALQQREQESRPEADPAPDEGASTDVASTADAAAGTTAHAERPAPATDDGSAVSDPPRPTDGSVFAPACEGGEGEAPSSDRPADRPADARGTATAGGEGRSVDGDPSVHWLASAQHDAIAAATAETAVDIAVLDAAVPQQRDPRDVWVSYDADRDEVAVSVEWSDVVAQTLLRLATAVTAPRLLAKAAPPRRLEDDDDGELDLGLPGGKVALRRGPGLGWLPDRVETGAGLLDALDDGRAQLLELSRHLTDAEGDLRPDVASEVCEVAHGLLGTATHLYNRLGIDLYRHVRLPNHRRDAGEARVPNLCRMLATAGHVAATYGDGDAYNSYAVQVEDDPAVRDDAWTTPAIEPGAAEGHHLGGWLVSGPGLVDGADPVLDPLQAADSLLDLAPQAVDDQRTFEIDLTIREGWSRRTACIAARRALDRKRLVPTPDAVGVWRALLDDPFAVTWGVMRGLGSEPAEDRRRIHLDEVRRALSTVPQRRLLPSLDREGNAGALLSALLGAAGPLSTADAARRADMSAETAATHRDRLAALGLVDVEDRGAGNPTWISAQLPTRDERHADDAPRPEFLASVDVDAGRSVARALADRPPPSDWELTRTLELVLSSLGCGLIDEAPDRWDRLRAEGVDLDALAARDRAWTRPWLDILASLHHRETAGVDGSWHDGPAGGACVLGAEPDWPDQQVGLDRWLSETAGGVAAAD